jgi:hypothetical protein
MMRREPCPHCGRPLDSVMQVVAKGNPSPPKGPKPGDVSVCIGCAGLHVFTKTLSRRKMTYLEEMELEREPEAWKAIQHARESIRGLPPEKVPM